MDSHDSLGECRVQALGFLTNQHEHVFYGFVVLGLGRSLGMVGWTRQRQVDIGWNSGFGV